MRLDRCAPRQWSRTGASISSVGAQGLQDDLETHLVVARGRAAVRNRVGAELGGKLGEVLGLNAALGADAQRVQLPATHVAHDQVLEHAVEKLVDAPR